MHRRYYICAASVPEGWRNFLSNLVYSYHPLRTKRTRGIRMEGQGGIAALTEHTSPPPDHRHRITSYLTTHKASFSIYHSSHNPFGEALVGLTPSCPFSDFASLLPLYPCFTLSVNVHGNGSFSDSRCWQYSCPSSE